VNAAETIASEEELWKMPSLIDREEGKKLSREEDTPELSHAMSRPPKFCMTGCDNQEQMTSILHEEAVLTSFKGRVLKRTWISRLGPSLIGGRSAAPHGRA
jgi:hypothetical protein